MQSPTHFCRRCDMERDSEAKARVSRHLSMTNEEDRPRGGDGQIEMLHIGQ